MNASASGALVARMATGSHWILLPVRNATFPSRISSVRRAPYSKFALAGVPWGRGWRLYGVPILQVHRRISTPEALEWSERTRHMFGGLYQGYAFGRLDERCFALDV